MQVLIVEDNVALRDLIVVGLKQAKLQPFGVSTIAEATHELSIRRYAAVVLDCGLPDGDGSSFNQKERVREISLSEDRRARLKLDIF